MAIELRKKQIVIDEVFLEGGSGIQIDMPVTRCTASYMRGHYDASVVGVPNAPRKNDQAVIPVMACVARIHDRSGALKAADIKREDGLR